MAAKGFSTLRWDDLTDGTRLGLCFADESENFPLFLSAKKNSHVGELREIYTRNYPHFS